MYGRRTGIATTLIAAVVVVIIVIIDVGAYVATSGETKTVTLSLTPEDLQLLDIDMHWRVVPGDFEIMVGKSSADIILQGILTVKP